MAPWWWFLCKPKHVGSASMILICFNNSRFFTLYALVGLKKVIDARESYEWFCVVFVLFLNFKIQETQEPKRYRPIHQSVSTGTQAPSVTAKSKVVHWAAFCTNKSEVSEMCEPPIANGVVENKTEQLTKLASANTAGDNMHLFVLVRQVDISYGAQYFVWRVSVRMIYLSQDLRNTLTVVQNL